jgi:ketosteroid isomerase-like protein
MASGQRPTNLDIEASMTRFFANFLEELEARTAIEDCLKRFARAVDRQDWAVAREAYHDDAFDDHGFFKGPPDQFLAHIAKLHTHQDHSMHFNTNVLIEFQSCERAFVETYVLVMQRYRAGAPKVPAGTAGLRNMACARYLDRFEKRNGDWRVAHRTLVFGDTVGEPLIESPVFPAEFTLQKHGLDDPLYRLRG